MRVLIISLFTSGAWRTHQATELELAQKHLDRGDEVTFLVCDSSIGRCIVNMQGDPSICSKCIKLHQKGFGLLDGQFEVHSLHSFQPISVEEIERSIEPVVSDRESAEAFSYEGHHLGLGAVSTLISESRDPDFDQSEWGQYLMPLTAAVVASYLGVRSFLKQYSGFDCAYVFNGRFDITKGAHVACRECDDLTVYTHERGASIRKYMAFENATPHCRRYLYDSARAAWEDCADLAERDRIARSFYEMRAKGKDEAWVNFLDRQIESALPEGFDKKRKNIVIFNSSEDEFVGLGPEWKNPIYESQSHGIERIVKEARLICPEVRFYLRMHPNLSSVDNCDTQSLNRLAGEGLDNLIFIPSQSEVSSYALLDASDVVLTFGSTVGIEATYRGKPSILAGHAFYEHFDSTYQVSSHAEVMRLIQDDLSAKPEVGALMYGYYMRTRGIDFEYWQASDFTKGTFKGNDLKSISFRKRMSRRLKRIIRAIFKK